MILLVHSSRDVAGVNIAQGILEHYPIYEDDAIPIKKTQSTPLRSAANKSVS